MTVFYNFYQLDCNFAGERVYLVPNSIIPEVIFIFLSYILAKGDNYITSKHADFFLKKQVLKILKPKTDLLNVKDKAKLNRLSLLKLNTK